MKCCVCYRSISANQDYIYMNQYPFVTGSKGHSHWICFITRVSQWRNFQDELNRDIKFIPNDKNTEFGKPESLLLPAVDIADTESKLKCGYCKQTDIDAVSDDHANFLLCEHKTVHFTCLNYFDFSRKLSCPLCPQTEKQAYAMWNLAHSSDEDLSRHSYISNNNAGNAVEDTSEYRRQKFIAEKKQGQSQSGDHAILTSSVVGIMFLQHVDSITIESEYRSKLKFMIEPTYKTPLRKLLFEMNFDTNGKHNHGDGPPLLATYCDTFYTLDELVHMGLTLPMVLYEKRQHLKFCCNYLYAEKLHKSFLGPNAFVSMLLAGIPAKNFTVVGLKKAFIDLQLIDFNVNGYFAAGGSPQLLEKFIIDAAKNSPSSSTIQFERLLPNFGATTETINRFYSAN